VWVEEANMSDDIGQNSTTSFVVALLSVVLCPFLGPIALNMVNEERRDCLFNDRPMSGMLTAAWVLSIIGTVECVLFGLYLAFVFIMMCALS